MKVVYFTMVGLALALAAPGCFTHGRSGVGLSLGFGVASVAPPLAYREYYGHPPRPGYFWSPGYWSWDGWQYSWRNGHWVAPKPGYRYDPHIWKKDGGNWHLHGGKWRKHR